MDKVNCLRQPGRVYGGDPPPRPVLDADVGGNPVQPGSKRTAGRECIQVAPSLKKRVLYPILRVVKRAKHAVTVQVQSPPVFIGEFAKSVGIPGQRSSKPNLVESGAHVTG